MAMIAFRKLCRNKEHLNNKAFKNNCFNKKLLQIIKNCIYIYIFFLLLYIYFLLYIYIYFFYYNSVSELTKFRKYVL